MPLSAVNFVPLTGPIKAVDHQQFYDLFTGVMTDQPVTFANTLRVGGSQAIGSALLRLNGVALQTANTVELRLLAADAQPVLSVDKVGKMSWGAGGAVGTDVTLERPSAGLLRVTGAAGLHIVGTVGVGAVPLAGLGLGIGGTLNAVGGNAQGLGIYDTLVAQANGDLLYGALIQPAFNANAKTGLTSYGLRIASGAAAGVNANYGLFIDEPTGATLNAAIFASGECIVGKGSLANGATMGFTQVSNGGGAPTGVPVFTSPGTVPIRFNSADNKMYAYINNGWKASAAFV